MAQYAVFIYEREAELPDEFIQEHVRLPQRIAEKGGRVVAGMAFEPPGTSTAIRGDLLTDGPFIETKEVLGGLFVIEARDLDHALSLAKMTPILSGGVEVRPLIDFQIVEEADEADA
nr:YciI family protein [uncultured Actinoplanes sp.]